MSRTVTMNVPVATFDATSVAEQLTVVVPSAKTLLDAGAQVTGRVPLTTSLADALNETRAPVGPVASIVTGAGRASTGLIVSRTTTTNVRVVELLRVSDAVQVTVVLPTAKVLPETGVQTGVTLPLTRSAAVAV